MHYVCNSCLYAARTCTYSMHMQGVVIHMLHQSNVHQFLCITCLCAAFIRVLNGIHSMSKQEIEINYVVIPPVGAFLLVVMLMVR